MSILFTTRKTIRNHASSGNVLIVATVLAMIVANIPSISHYYSALWDYHVSLQIGDFNLFSHHGQPMTFMQFINDALMAIFFFTIGLEIKREVLVGELASFKQAMLPIIAACGGMLVPVLIFSHQAEGTDFIGGSAIPMATDIAFSLGVLGMLGKRVPISLKVFLTTLAVVDDIGGIIVIAVFYTSTIEYMLLVYAFALLILLFLGAVMHIKSKMYYISLGIAVWFLFLNSGIHPTIAGVLVAFCIPASPVTNIKKFIGDIRNCIVKFPIPEEEQVDNSKYILSKEQMNWFKQIESASDKAISPLQDLEDTLHPIVDYIIVPLFAFANAGICFSGMEFSDVYSGVSLAIICGLVLGKFAGIFLFSFATIKLRLAPMPELSNWKMLAAVSMLGGIGFTVSLFIANLSFGSMGAEGVELLNDSKIGIITGSILSGLLGYIFLSFCLPKKPLEEE